MNPVAVAGFVNVAPPFVDFAQTTASRCCAPRPENERQATKTVPLLVTAMSQNWLPWIESEIFWGCEYVSPPSVEREKKTPLLPETPVKRAQQTYTFPHGRDALPAKGLFTPRSTSSCTLSLNMPAKGCEGVPFATSAVQR
jgi:hypothetical protein